MDYNDVVSICYTSASNDLTINDTDFPMYEIELDGEHQEENVGLGVLICTSSI